MPKFDLTIGGNTYEVDAPNEQALPEIADTIAQQEGLINSNSSEQKSNIPFLPNSNRVNDLINNRSSMLDSLMKEVNTPYSGNILQKTLKAGVTGMKTLGTVMQNAEAAVANPLLELQKGKVGTDLFKEIMDGVSGRKLGQLGDLVRTTGFGGGANEALSSVTGFMGSVGLTNLATKGKLLDGAEKIKTSVESKLSSMKENNKFFFMKKADMLSDGADDVIDSVKFEMENLYNKIGENKILAEDQSLVQGIVNRIPKDTLTRVSKQLGIDLGNGELPANLNTIKSIKGIIGRIIPKKVWSGIDDATEVQAQLMDDYHQLGDVIAKNAGDSKDELLALNKKYKEVMDFRKIITGITKKKATGLTSTNIRNIRSDSMQGELKALEDFSNKFLPKTEEILKDVDRFNRNMKIKEGLKTFVKYGVGLEAARRFIVNPLMNSTNNR